MKFYVNRNYRAQPKQGEPRTCTLVGDNWDDFHFRTTFDLYYADAEGEAKKIGTVKVMTFDMKEGTSVEIPDEFDSLDESYCSLGQEQSYYEELMGVNAEDREKILQGLRDCVHDQERFNKFEEQLAMQKSLLRGVSSKEVRKLYKSILKGKIELTPFHFVFNFNDDTCDINVRVKPHSIPPTNVHVLIGKNGVGKTRLLAGIADCLAGNEDLEGIGIEGGIDFPDRDEAPSRFANLVAVVFSAFDGFTPIPDSKVQSDIKYNYVGLKNIPDNDDEEVKFKNEDDIIEDFEKSLEVCISTQRRSRWLDAIKALNSDTGFAELELHTLDYDDKDDIAVVHEHFSTLSSGHKIVLLSITKLVELVDERTLVLIDEPENHLHPPLLSSFIRALSNLLIQRNGVAIVATHSPVVLQEVPKSCVSVIRRSGDDFTVDRPSVETFGENVGILTHAVFGLEVTASGFYKMIADASHATSYEDVVRQFHGQIGAEGKAMLRSLILEDDSGD